MVPAHQHASSIPVGLQQRAAAMGLDADVSLRPLSLRPGAGVNPFAGFAKGAGAGLKNKVRASMRSGLASREVMGACAAQCSAGQASPAGLAAAGCAARPQPACGTAGGWRRSDCRLCAMLVAPAAGTAWAQTACGRQPISSVTSTMGDAACWACHGQPPPALHTCSPHAGLLCCASPQVVAAAPEYIERKKKPPGEIIRYSRDFLMKFVQVQWAGWAGMGRSVAAKLGAWGAAMSCHAAGMKAPNQRCMPPPARAAAVHARAPGAAVLQQRHPAGGRRPGAGAAAAAAAARGGRRGG